MLLRFIFFFVRQEVGELVKGILRTLSYPGTTVRNKAVHLLTMLALMRKFRVVLARCDALIALTQYLREASFHDERTFP